RSSPGGRVDEGSAGRGSSPGHRNRYSRSHVWSPEQQQHKRSVVVKYRYMAALVLAALGTSGLNPAFRHRAEATGKQTTTHPVELERGLIGYWKLRGDCRDHSGHGHHGTNHGVDLQTGSFDGRGAYVEIPSDEQLRLGRGDFTVSAWVHTDRIV